MAGPAPSLTRVLRVAAALLLVSASFASADATDDFIRAQMKQQNIPGLAVAVVKDGTIVKAQGYGIADLKTKAPVTRESVFKIASVSKQFVAAGIMLLVQDGRLDVGDPVTQYIQDAPAPWREITIRHLLTHTAGLTREAPGFKPDSEQPDAALIRSAYSAPLLFKPGERWSYSNVGYVALAEIITRVSGRPWNRFIAERVFTPAGMTATRPTGDAPANRVTGYTDNDKLTPAADWKAVRPSGAFVSTVLDLARWDAVLYTDTVLSEAARREMWTQVTLNDGTSHPYGFGWHVYEPPRRRSVWHGGGLPGFNAQFRRYVDDRITVIILMNSDDVDDESIAAGVAELYLPDR